jgi:hypothetical protein
MTMIDPDQTRPGAAASTPRAAFSLVMSAATEVVASKVGEWTEKLNGIAESAGEPTARVGRVADRLAEGGGAQRQAGVRGVQAGLLGKNPVWAAIKGAWTGGGTAVRVAVVAAAVSLVLLLLLSPVLLLVLLVCVLIVAAVHKVRSAKN